MFELPIVLIAKAIGTFVPLPVVSFIVSISVSIIRLRRGESGLLSKFVSTIRAYMNKPEVVEARNALIRKGFHAAQSRLERAGVLQPANAQSP